MKALMLNDCSRYHVGSWVVTQCLQRLGAEQGIALAPCTDFPAAAPIEEYDAVVINGEGTFHHNSPRSLGLQSVAQHFREAGKKAYLINTVVQAQQMDASIYDRVICRESLSAEYVRHLSPATRVSVIPDVSFCVPFRPAAPPTRSGVLFIDSVSLQHTAMIERVAQRHGGEMLGLCKWQGGVEELLTLMSQKELIVTGRFHGAIFAMLAGTPLLALPSNTWKTRGMLKDFGRSELYCKTEEQVEAALAGERPAPVAIRPQLTAELWRSAFAEIAGRPAIAPKPTVLVGNGPGVLRSKLGKVIDAFDEIVRFNVFRIRGFEEHVGTRTTLWSTFGQGVLPADEDQRPKRMVFVHGTGSTAAYQPEIAYHISSSFYAAARENIAQVTKRPNPGEVRPSSGFLVALWFLEVVGTPVIHVIGFDHFSKEHSKQHHYWLPKNYGKPKEHDGDAEAEWLRTRYAGRVVYL